jgi:hypothetical protein
MRLALASTQPERHPFPTITIKKEIRGVEVTPLIVLAESPA